MTAQTNEDLARGEHVEHVEHDMHAAESQVIGDGSAAGVPQGAARVDPGAKRVIKWVAIAFAVAAVLIGLLVFLAASKKDMNATVQLPARASGGQTTDVVQTDYEKGRLAEFQREKAEESQAKGGVYVPPPAGAPTSIVGPNASPGAGSYQTYVSNPQVAAQQSGTLQDPVRQQAIQEGLNRQLGQLLADAAIGVPIERVQAFEERKQAQVADGAGSSARVATSGSTQVEDPNLPAPLTILAARTTSPIDTGKTSYVSAEVVGGKFAGAFLKGVAVLNKGEGLQVTFTDIRFNGKTARINAVALDEQTSADALAGNIDRHLLTKYVLPVAFATLSGAASAIAQRGTEVVTNGLSTSVSVPVATDRQAAAAGLSSGTQIGQQVVQALAQQPNTVTLPANTLVGVLFNTVQTSSTAQAPVSQPQQAAPERQVRQQVQPQQQPVTLVTGMNYGSFAPQVLPYNPPQVRE